MQMLYQSDSYIVVEFNQIERGGYELVDRTARKEIYLEGLLAEGFKTGVQAIADKDGSPEAFDEFIGGYFTLGGQQPVVAH